MHCAHWELGECSSCDWLPIDYAAQLDAKDREARNLLAAATAPDAHWLAPCPSRRVGFRNKAKMVVSGTAEQPILGLDGVDLTDCPLYPPELQSVFDPIKRFISAASLTPYQLGPIADLAGQSKRKKTSGHSQRGELKNVIVTIAPDGEMMVRFVLRSREALDRIAKHLPQLQTDLPQASVVSANIHGAHQAVLEGAEEILLTERRTLPMPLEMNPGRLTLLVGPRAFFQTNTAMAANLYQRAREWAVEIGAQTIWDLYCGVGGFALACAGPGRRVLGVETTEEAVACARASAEINAVGDEVEFVAADATQWVTGTVSPLPDLVIVNPPRRGIGEDLATWLEKSAVPWVIYSSCNAKSLARDLANMPSLRIAKAQVIDMFPNTSHYEVIALLRRSA